jgi:hypothetical protein
MERGGGVDSGKYIDSDLRIDNERKQNGSQTSHQNEMKAHRILLSGLTREGMRYATIPPLHHRMV